MKITPARLVRRLILVVVLGNILALPMNIKVEGVGAALALGAISAAQCVEL